MTSGPELAEGFDCGLFKPSLRASLESLDSARDAEPVEAPGAKHPVETCNERFSLFAGAYSRIQGMRELCRLALCVIGRSQFLPEVVDGLLDPLL